MSGLVSRVQLVGVGYRNRGAEARTFAECSRAHTEAGRREEPFNQGCFRSLEGICAGGAARRCVANSGRCRLLSGCPERAGEIRHTAASSRAGTRQCYSPDRVTSGLLGRGGGYLCCCWLEEARHLNFVRRISGRSQPSPAEEPCSRASAETFEQRD